MKTLINTSCNATHTFEIVEKIPADYFVWNIGDNMTAGYIPVCESAGGYSVNVKTLKAIALEENEIKILRKSAGYGVNDLKSARRASKLNPKTRRAAEKKEIAIATLPIFERISE